jgi:hypothetical protein
MLRKINSEHTQNFLYYLSFKYAKTERNYPMYVAIYGWVLGQVLYMMQVTNKFLEPGC